MAAERASTVARVGLETPCTCNSAAPLRSGWCRRGRPTSCLTAPQPTGHISPGEAPEPRRLLPPNFVILFQKMAAAPSTPVYRGDRHHREQGQTDIFVGHLESDDSYVRIWHPEPLSVQGGSSRKSFWWQVCPHRTQVSAQWGVSPRLCLGKEYKKLCSLSSLEEPWRPRGSK